MDVQAYRRTTRRSLLGLVMVLALLFIGATAELVFIAHHENHHQLRHSQGDARQALSARLDQLARVVKDYAIRDEAYLQFGGGQASDPRWAVQDTPWGPAMAATYSLEAVFVVGPDSATRYALIQGTLQPSSLEHFVTGDLRPLLAAARQVAWAGDAVYGFYDVAGQPAVVHAAAVRPQYLPSAAGLQGLAVLVFVDVLDHARVQQWMEDYGLPGLVADLAGQPAEGQASLVSTAPNGTHLRLRWYAEAPGNTFMTTLLPLLGLALVLATLAAVFFYRSALRNAERVDASRAYASESQARFRAVAEAASDWIWETDAQGWLTYLCDRFESATGFAPDAWVGQLLVTLLDYNHPLFATNALAEVPGRWRQVPCRLRDAAGQWHECLLTVRAVLDHGQIVGYRGSVLDLGSAAPPSCKE